jgi:hypothetical protein
MENITHRTIIQNHDPTQIRLNGAQILNIRPIPKRAMLPIISPYKELPLLLQPVDHRIRVFLDTCSENNELEPLADFAEEIVAMGSFVHVVEDRVLRTEGCAAAETDGRVEFYFDHMA